MTGYVPRPGSIPTLPVPDLSGVGSAHLVGIGGAGMSGIARLMMARGVRVGGSDLRDGPELSRLRTEGAEVWIGHDPSHVSAPDVLVVSTAIGPDNVEVAAARERGIPVLHRAQVLAALMRGHRRVAIAGTHGKTTTTAMLSVVLERAGLDPTYLIGGDLNETASNARAGKGDIFVAEADESDGSFLLLEPDLATITNVDSDHLDFYRDAEEISEAFVVFAQRSARLIACGDDPGARGVVAAAGVEAVTYGTGEDSEVRLDVLSVTGAGSRGLLTLDSSPLEIVVPQPGRHQLVNAAGVVAAARALGVEPPRAVEALAEFGGVRRRFERRGSGSGAAFVDDYAHHPVEIEATLAAARAEGGGRILAVFQPHRYSRTAVLGAELGASLSEADLVVVTDVYGAGEDAMPGITGKVVLEGLLDAAPGKRAVYLPHKSDVAPFLAREVRAGDTVLTLGAGDIALVSEQTLARLRGKDG